MAPSRIRFAVLFAVLAATAFSAGCRRTVVIVPQPSSGYTARDTLYGTYKGDRVQVTFRFDTLWRVDTVTRTDTLWRDGTRTIERVDTVRVVTRMTTPSPTPTPTRVPRPTGSTPGATDVDTVVVVRRDTVVVARRDTVMVTRRDTIRVVVRDTIRVVVRDTIRVPGRRELFVPPGHYPPAGQCRVWIHDLPPGRQASPAPCASLGQIPPGAFVLFGGNAWDFDYDWVSESSRSKVPPEIIALKRR